MAAVEPARAARRYREALEAGREGVIAARESADGDTLGRAQQVVNCVLARPTEGADSALYQTFGYTRQSDRKSGLTRKRNPPPAK